MPNRFRYLAVFIACLHLVQATAGEALHLLPGMGHFEEMPCGNCLWNGGADYRAQVPLPRDPAGEFRALGSVPGEVLGADECPICLLVTLSGKRESAPSLPADGTLFAATCTSTPPVAALDVVALYAARAPPAEGCISPGSAPRGLS